VKLLTITVYTFYGLFVWLMVLNAAFNNISVISWRSVLLMEDPEKTSDLSKVTDKLYHIILYVSPWSRFELTTSVVTGTDYISSCRSNYQMNTTRNLFEYLPYTSWHLDNAFWNKMIGSRFGRCRGFVGFPSVRQQNFHLTSTVKSPSGWKPSVIGLVIVSIFTVPRLNPV
jgi:hypothetical protein